MKKRIVILTGAGVSADSGINTFRDADGLWEGHDVTQVATPEAFQRNPELVLRFYNERRQQLSEVEPNAGHLALVELEQKYDVQIITQNVDDLHERAGSSNILHLHGELLKGRSSVDPKCIVELEEDIEMGDLAPDGSQLRPHIVWFGEAVPMMEIAAGICLTADMCIIIGTSMVVYPAAGLVDFVPMSSPIYVVDPKVPDIYTSHTIEFIAERGAQGVPKLVEQLMKEA
ncbi:MAG: NAD-dependent deacylase [Bacteroidota bacterium]